MSCQTPTSVVSAVSELTSGHPRLRCSAGERFLVVAYCGQDLLRSSLGVIDQIIRIVEFDLMGFELVDVEQVDRAVAPSDHVEIEVDCDHRRCCPHRAGNDIDVELQLSVLQEPGEVVARPRDEHQTPTRQVKHHVLASVHGGSDPKLEPEPVIVFPEHPTGLAVVRSVGPFPSFDPDLLHPRDTARATSVLSSSDRPGSKATANSSRRDCRRGNHPTGSATCWDRETEGVVQLVVIVGPVASGKSTVAHAPGERFRTSGRRVAVLDVDEVVETIGGFTDLSAARFQQAMFVFGELVGVWLAQGYDVIAHGPFFQLHEDEAILHAVPAGIEPRRVLLLSTLDAAFARVKGNPDRSLSTNPDLLNDTYERVAELLPTMLPSEWVFDTTTTAPQTIVDRIAETLLT